MSSNKAYSSSLFKLMRSDNAQKLLILWLAFFVSVCYHYIAYVGHYGYDDLHYARIASNFNQGIIDYSDHFTFRWPIVFFTALAYKLGGVSDFTSAIPSLLITFSSLFIVYTLLKKQTKTVVLFGIALVSFNHWSIFYADKIMTDIYIALSVLFCVYCIYRYKFDAPQKKQLLWAFLLSCGFLFGIIAKGTNVLLIPVFAFLFVLDLIQRKPIKFWLFSLLFTILLFLAYMGIIRYLTGNIFQLFDAIAGNSYLNFCSYDLQSKFVLFKRLFYDYFEMMIFQCMTAGLIFVLAYFFQKGTKKIFLVNDEFSFFLLVSLLLFLSSNFMSISLLSYNPMCVDPRHYLFLIPIAAIPAAKIIGDFVDNKQLSTNILLALFILTVLALFIKGNSFLELYLPLLFLFTAYAYFPTHKIGKQIFCLLFILVLLIKPITMVAYAKDFQYEKQKSIVFEQLIQKKENCYVISDYVQKSLGNYYNSFGNTNHCEFLEFNKFSFDSLDITKKRYVLLNKNTQYLSELDTKDIPEYATENNLDKTLVFVDENLKMSIYELKYTLVSEPIYTSLNDFESQKKFWNFNSKDSQTEMSYSKNTANAVKEYSATFAFPLDSIEFLNAEKATIKANAFCRVDKINTSKIVISLDQNEKNYKWESVDIKKDIKAFDNWCQVNFEVTLNVAEIKDNSLLKVYFLNSDSSNMFVDDFKVSIERIIKR
jgi:4-amino-4-deoxy-L-arabinose transferase-like glycosyltransferase